MSYRPGKVPVIGVPLQLARYLAGEFRRLANAVGTAETVTLTIRNAAPGKIEDGMIVYADGTNWNPGSGAGVYAREAGAWVKL